MDLKNIKIKDGFWANYQSLIRDVVLPYQWEALNDNIEDAPPSYCISNFKIAAGLKEGKFEGMVFQDSDLFKWIEAASYQLAIKPNEKLENTVDNVIDLMEKAQQPDGYLNTHYIINGLEKRFTDLAVCHELYCLGHMIEAAVAYFETTKKRKILDIVCRYSDLVDSIFGLEVGKKKGYPGHQEIELALIKLFNITGEKRYADLATYFINQRGQEPNYFIEEHKCLGDVPNLMGQQAHIPVRQQDKAVGHAVRAVYMYAGMADVARVTKDEELLSRCKILFDNIYEKQMYITGGIGQTRICEAFTFDYDLPNDTAYNETCASIGMVFFAQRMLEIEFDSKYSDIIETQLYNGIIGGMQKDGRYFSYVNPLSIYPEAVEKDPSKEHLEKVRKKWFGCACCPPNIARLITSLGKYLYTVDNDTIYIHHYTQNEAEFEVDNLKVNLSQKTNFPWTEKVDIDINGNGNKFKIALRVPAWCENMQVKIDGIEVANYVIDKGYLYIEKEWLNNNIQIVLPMQVEIMQSNINVRANVGKVAIKRGPVVYCLEDKDNGNNLHTLKLNLNKEFTQEFNQNFFDGAVILHTKGLKENLLNNNLYFDMKNNNKIEKEVDLTFIPYYLWGNRGIGEMETWIRYKY